MEAGGVECPVRYTVLGQSYSINLDRMTLAWMAPLNFCASSHPALILRKRASDVISVHYIASTVKIHRVLYGT